MAVRRVAILGDIGAHLGPFVAALTELGADPARGSIPDDLSIIQVGDLVHRGPDSDAVVALAERFLDSSPDRYTQLAGNHEAEHFGGPQFFECRCGRQTLDTLHAWARNGQLRVAAAVESAEHGPVLVTHAGLTAVWYHPDLARPQAAAAALNRWWADPESRPALLEAGEMLHTPDGSHGSAGPLWASERELLSSWAHIPLPYSQVHGHNSAYDWARGRWHDPSLAELVPIDVDVARRRTTTRLSGGTILGVDPDFLATAPTWPLTPLVLTQPGRG